MTEKAQPSEFLVFQFLSQPVEVNIFVFDYCSFHDSVASISGKRAKQFNYINKVFLSKLQVIQITSCSAHNQMIPCTNSLRQWWIPSSPVQPVSSAQSMFFHHPFTSQVTSVQIKQKLISAAKFQFLTYFITRLH